MLAATSSAPKPTYQIASHSTALTPTQKESSPLDNNNGHSVRLSDADVAGAEPALHPRSAGDDKRLAATIDWERKTINPSGSTGALAPAPMFDPNMNPPSQVATGDILLPEELPEHEPHFDNDSQEGCPVEDPHSSILEPMDSPGTTVTPRPRATPKALLERKHWSLSHVTNQPPADSNQTNTDCWTKSKIRYSCGNLSDQEMVTQGTPKVGQPKKSPLAQALTSSDPMDMAKTTTAIPPRAMNQVPERQQSAISRRPSHQPVNELGLSSSFTMSSTTITANDNYRPVSTAEPLHASPWVLPPIPSFAELGLQFDQNHSGNNTSNRILPHQGNTSNLEEHLQHTLDRSEMQEQYNSPEQEQEQQWPNSSPSCAVPTTDALVIRSESIEINTGEEYCCNLAVPPEIDRSTKADMVPTYTTSIFDDVQSDDNESYIVWSTPLSPSSTKLSAVPPTQSMGLTTATTPAASLTSPVQGSSQSVQPSSSVSAEASSFIPPQSSLPPPPSPSTTNNESSSPPMSGHLFSRRRSVAVESLKGKAKDGDMDHGKHDDTQQPTTRIEGAHDGTIPNNSTSPSLQMPKTLTTFSTPSLNDNDHVIMAATVEKLVQKLTSEIDYTFLTDFFLIYRLFITPMDLLNLFILRFQWALVDDSPQRQIVRIRTFVTLRHWLLNYFGYDFMRSKDLRQTLVQRLRSLAEHPTVMASTRDQRIIRELRRYAQSLKKIHYRALAQQKLERQSRKLDERQRCQYARRASLQSHHAASAEWPTTPVKSGRNDGPGASRRSSVGNHESMIRRSGFSEPLTEELSVEFRSSDQSDDSDQGDEDDDSVSDDSEEDDDFELSSDDSVYKSEYDTDNSIQMDDNDDDEGSASDEELSDYRPEQTTGFDPEGIDNYIDSIPETAQDAVSRTGCHLPSPRLSPRSQKFKQGGTGSLRSQHIMQSGASSVVSKPLVRRIRPGLPDFTRIDPSSSLNPHSPTTSSRQGAGSHPQSRTRTQSRPISTNHPMFSSPLQSEPLSTIASVRSVEPYINPPPRSVNTIERKGTWSRYMTATVDRLSKMKSMFSPSSKKNHHYPQSPTSTHSFGSKRSGSSAISQVRSTRYWQGSRSDPENDKFSHYFLGSCSGMNMLLSSSEDRHYSFNRRYGSERDHGREEAAGDWSSDDDYSQYEMTRRSSRQLESQEANAGEEHEPVDPQLLETRLEQAQYPLYVKSAPSIMESTNTREVTGALVHEDEDNVEEHSRSDQQPQDAGTSTTIPDSTGLVGHQDQPYGRSSPSGLAVNHQAAPTLYPGLDPSHKYGKLPRRHSSDLLDQASPLSPTIKRLMAGIESPALMPHDYSASNSTTEVYSSTGSQLQPTKQVQKTLSRGRSKSQPQLKSSASSFGESSLESISARQSGSVMDSDITSRRLHPLKPSHSVFNIEPSGSPTPSMTRRVHSNFVELNPSRYHFQTTTAHQSYQGVGLPPERVPALFMVKEAHALPFVLRYRSELIAQQLCLIERELLSRIQWYELVDAGWTKKSTTSKDTPTLEKTPKIEREDQERDSGNRISDAGPSNTASVPAASTPRPKRREESVGIKRLVDRFNLTCQWVTSEIVRIKDMDLRVKVVEKFIRIAHTCYNHSNFSSLIQVMLGLQAHSVSRLSQTWNRVRAQEMRIMHDLVEFTSPFHNWRHLRDAMKNIADEWGGNGGTPLPSPASDKPTSGVAFIVKSSSKSWIQEGSKAWKGTLRSSDSNGMTLSAQPSSFFSNRPSNRQRGFSAPVLPSTPSSSTKFKRKDKSRQAESEAPKSGRQGGCIPFLGLYLADLVFNSELPSFVEPKASSSSPDPESHRTTSSSPLVNMHKHRTTATIIKRVLTFRTMSARYPFQPEPEVQEILMAIQGLDSAELLRLSYQCEERASDAVRG